MAALTGAGKVVTLAVGGGSPGTAVANLNTLTGAHKYWRLHVYEVNGGATYTTIDDLYLYDKTDPNAAATDNGATDIYSASSQASTNAGGYNVFDHYDYTTEGGNGTDWLSAYDDQEGSWVQAQFVNAVDINRFTVVATGKNYNTSSAPTEVGLQYSDDGVAWYERVRAVLSAWPTSALTSPGNAAAYYKTVEIYPAITTFSTLPLLSASSTLTPPGVPVVDPEAGTAEVTLPSLSATGQQYSYPVIALNLPKLSGTSSGHFGNMITPYLPINLNKLTASATLVSERFITQALSLPAFTAAGNGYTIGTLVGSVLPALTGSASAAFGGNGSAQISVPVLGASSTLSNVAEDAGGVLGVPSVTSSMISGLGGPIQASLPGLSATGVASDGTDGVNLPALQASATGVGGASSVGYITLPTLSAVGASSTAGDGAVLPALDAQSAMVSGRKLSATLSLPALSSSGNVGDTGGAPLPALTAQISAVTGQSGVGYCSLGQLAVSGAIGAQDGENALPALSASITGSNGLTMTVRGTLGALDAAATVGDDSGIVLPAFAVTSASVAGNSIRGVIRLGKLTAAGAVGAGVSGGSLPPLSSTSSSVTGRRFFANIRLPAFSASGVATDVGAGAPLPALQVVASAAAGSNAYGTIYLPAPVVTGEIQNESLGGSAQGSVELPAFSVGVAALSENLYEGRATLAALTLAAVGAAGRTFEAQLTLPLFEVSALGISDHALTVSLMLPALRVRASGAAPIVGADEAVVMNLSNRGVTRFAQWPMNSFAQWQGLQLAACSEGIVALEGDTDAGALIAASIRAGALDGGSSQLKRVASVHAGLKGDGSLELTVSVDEGTTYRYPLVLRQTDQVHGARATIGKGLKGRYWQFGLDNVAGADFSLDSFEPDTVRTKRRVRSRS